LCRYTNSLFQWRLGQLKELPANTPTEIWLKRHNTSILSALSKEEWSYLGNTFKEGQKKEINLGLDLKGGMNVTLEVAVEDVLRALSNYSQDKSFNDAIALAKEMQKSSQADFLTLFGRAFEQVSPNGQL